MNEITEKPGVERLEMTLSDRLQEANSGGVTTWLGLDRRLDYGVLSKIVNYRRLLIHRLHEKLGEGGGSYEALVEERRETAKKLLEALKAYETALEEENDDGGNGDNEAA